MENQNNFEKASDSKIPILEFNLFTTKKRKIDDFRLRWRMLMFAKRPVLDKVKLYRSKAPNAI